MKTRYKFLFLALVSVSIGLFVRYFADNLLLHMIVQSLTLLVLFLTAPDSFLALQKDTDSLKEAPTKTETTNNDLVLVVAISVASVIGGGIFLFHQDIRLALFTTVILFVSIYRYKKIKAFYDKKMMWLFNIK